MVEVAIGLFERDGYDATTMESIAEQAEVGTTTLYRYFPSKELLLLEQFADVLDLASRLRTRPDGEPLDVALGAVLLDVARTVDDPERNIVSLRALIDGSSGPRAGLWDFVLRARDDLAAVIAEREGRAPDDLGARVTAAVALEVLQIIDAGAQGDSRPTRVEATEAVLTALPLARVHLPAMVDPVPTG